MFCLDYPIVDVGPTNPYRVEIDHTAEMNCEGKIQIFSWLYFIT